MNDRMMGMRPVTVSGLLNAIDGVAAQEGRLIFLTTNHKDRLSEALIRPGRVDAQYYMGYASKAGAGELFDQFFPPSHGVQVKLAREAFIDEVESNVHSFAKLRGVLMQARDDPELAAKGMRALFTEDESNDLKPIELNQLKQNKVTRLERFDDAIQSRLALIEHAAKCEGCSSSNCKKVLEYFAHAKNCSERHRSTCKPCTTIVNLSVAHARRCTAKTDCPVPFCDRIRTKEVQEEAAFVESLFEESDSVKEKQPLSVAEQPTREAESNTSEETGEGKKSCA